MARTMIRNLARRLSRPGRVNRGSQRAARLSIALPAVANAEHRLDLVERRVDLLELVAYAPDVAVDRVLLDVALPRDLHHGVVGLHVPRATRQRLHQPELRQRQIDRLAVPT